jgi:hypothetical protein
MQICEGAVLGSATHREASCSRSNFSWGTFRYKRPSATLAATSGFDQPSMIALASSRMLERGARLWKGCQQSAENPVFHFPKRCLWTRMSLTGNPANRPRARRE